MKKLVEDSKNQIKKLLDHCDLEWDKNCLKSIINTKKQRSKQ